MIKKPFTLNTKRLGLMASSAAIVVAMAAPVALADEPGLDTPIDDSLEEIVQPSDEEEPEPGLDTPIEEPPVVEDPAPEPEPGDDTPIEEPPVVDPEPEPEPGDDTPIEEPPVEEEPTPDPGDTGTEPDPTPVPPEDPIEEDPTPVDDEEPSDEVTLPIRVMVHFVDEAGNPTAESVGIRGEVGDAYFAENLEIPGYEITGVEGAEKGTFTDEMINVTYTYMALGENDPTDPAPTEPEEPGDDTPIDDSGEELDEDAPTDNSDDEEPTDETPIDDSDEELDEDAPAAGNGDPTEGDSDETPVDDSAEDVKESVTDEDSTNVAVDESLERGEAPVAKVADGTNAADVKKANDGELKAIPQASADTNWGMIGAGIAALGAAAAMLFGRREKSGTETK